MLSRRKALVILGGVSVSCAPLMAFGHDQKTTLSKIEWSAADKALYITHSYHIHDAETALAAKRIIKKPDLTSLRARAKLALYTQDTFKLSADGLPLELDILGAEFEARNVYVYQQAFLAKKPTQLQVYASMLREIIPGQLNHVDSWLSNTVQSLTFRDGDNAKKLLSAT